MDKSIAVLGLGRYGRSLTEELFRLGAQILIADRDKEKVQNYASKAEVAVCADLENEEELKALGLENMDVVVVAMGSSLGPSVLSVMFAKDAGVPCVIAKSSSARMASLLKKVGADEIIDPERETGTRTAQLLSSKTLEAVFDVDENLCLAEVKPKPEWIGKTLAELDLRRKHHLNVVAIRKGHGTRWSFVEPDHQIPKSSVLLVAVEKKKLKELEA